MTEFIVPTPQPDVDFDPNGGFLCLTVYYQPPPEDATPGTTGQKVNVESFMAVAPRQLCLCGSGKRYATCCRRAPIWRPICPNPGMEGYSFVAAATMTFRDVDTTAVRERLADDLRLELVEDTAQRTFWLLTGNPDYHSPYGIVSFGDIDLDHRAKTVQLSALSVTRMKALLALLQEDAGGLLPKRAELDESPAKGFRKDAFKPTSGKPARRKQK